MQDMKTPPLRSKGLNRLFLPTDVQPIQLCGHIIDFEFSQIAEIFALFG